MGGGGTLCHNHGSYIVPNCCVNIQAVLGISLQNGCIDECHVANLSPNKNRGLGWNDDGG